MPGFKRTFCTFFLLFTLQTLVKAEETWWSRKPLSKPALPAEDSWCRNEVDRFILQRLKQQKLSPSEEASPLALIRRVTYDLIGLPPTPEEIDAFVRAYQKDSEAAYVALVDRLLDSPHYGEKYARHWLDVVKYADTCGYDKDKLRPNAWPYRDYVIRSLNEDKPYPRFIQEQIAGDALFPGNPDGILGLGFLATGPWDFIGHVEVSEAKIDGKIARNLDRDDILSNTMNTFCGVTIQCARCHEHKGDPITIEHYYSLQSVFAAIDKADRSYDVDPKLQQQRIDLETQLAQLKKEKSSLEKSIQKTGDPELSKLQKQIQKLQAQIGPVAKTAEHGYHSHIVKSPDQTKWVQIDLGQRMDIRKIILHACHDNFGGIGAGFGFPQRFKIVASNRADFSRSETLINETENDFLNPGLTPVEYGTISSARYIRVVATKLALRSKDYIFALDEVEVLDEGNKNQALKAKVTSLDSIEAPVRWRRTNLTDGLWAKAPDNQAAKQLAELKKQEKALLDQLHTPEYKTKLAHFNKAIQQTEESLKKLPVGKLVYAAATDFKPRGNFKPTKGKPRPIHVLRRGDVNQVGKPVRPGTVPLFEAEDWKFNLSENHQESERRAALANWIIRKDHPLTWRVIANRLWQWHFEKPLVPSPNDFGELGQLPTHPELLDWLAMYFRDNGGSFKKVHRLILTSATYRQASNSSNARAMELDAQNKLLWKMNRRKLSAEEIRDSVLSVSGKLNLQQGGPGFYLFKLEKTAHSPHYEYHKFDPEDSASHRRSIYRFIVRSQPNPFMTTLDCADSSQSTPVRNETLTALQALSLLNNKFTLVMAQNFAKRLQQDAKSLDEQIQWGHRLLTGRTANPEEMALMKSYAQQHGLPNLCRALFSLSEFTYLD